MAQQQSATESRRQKFPYELATHRFPQISALVNTTMRVGMETGAPFELKFVDSNTVKWERGVDEGMDWYEAVEVARNTLFIDMTFINLPRETQTFVISTETRQALSIRTIIREGDVGKDPLAAHVFSVGQIGHPVIAPVGHKPSLTRDLFGLRAIYAYNPELVIEHVYLNSERYCWHCIGGPLRGQANVERCSLYKWDENQYVFCSRALESPVSALFFYDWNTMRSTGKFFSMEDDGSFRNTPAGALINKVSLALYPLEAQPL